MIPRYSLPEMTAVWSEPRKLELWREVEIAALEGWSKLGVVPVAAVEAARATTQVDPDEWKAREEVTHHDLAAFVDVMSASAGEGAEWIHYGLTSSDVVDTAQGVMLGDAAALLQRRLDDLFAVVKAKAIEHKDTAMVGRTHGIWAEATTFGLKLATWTFEVDRHRARLAAAKERVAVGKISGAVGTYAHVPPSVEEHVCTSLGIGVEPASSQVVQRDRHAEFLAVIAGIGATLERFATEIRHLQRSEVGEAREPFAKGQKGSSAMPHKRNPIRTENVTGLARLLRAYAGAGFEDVALWHERDISHSSVERVALPDACLASDFALVRMTKVIDGLVVDADRMQENLEATRGLVYSQAVLLALVAGGNSRDEAYRLVQRNAMRAWDEGLQLQDLLAADPEVDLSDDALKVCFDPARAVANASVVWDRLAAL
ncbi:MAG: adenylosuccinate lyase [Acidimicrobiia bacterium]|nr:adenylosuccinate lyase [Acidimicrobiia bacterium]